MNRHTQCNIQNFFFFFLLRRILNHKRPKSKMDNYYYNFISTYFFLWRILHSNFLGGEIVDRSGFTLPHPEFEEPTFRK